MPRAIPVHRPRSPIPAAHAARKRYERRPDRREDKDFYKSPAWRALRLAFLQANPLCRDCKALGRYEPARHVHHIVDRKQRPDLAWDWDNLQALCVPCHNRKRADR